jgi:hypothetical protein
LHIRGRSSGHVQGAFSFARKALLVMSHCELPACLGQASTMHDCNSRILSVVIPTRSCTCLVRHSI